MALIEKKLKTEKNNATEIRYANLYSNIVEVGKNRIKFEIDGTPVYAQTTSEHNENNVSHLKFLKDGIFYKIRLRSEDPDILTNVLNNGCQVNAPINAKCICYDYVTSLDEIKYVSYYSWEAPVDMTVMYTVKIEPSIFLDACTKFKLIYGDDENSLNNEKIFSPEERFISVFSTSVDKFFKIQALDINNNVLYESNTKHCKCLYTNIDECLSYYTLYAASDENGSNLVKIYSGPNTSYEKEGNEFSWFKVISNSTFLYPDGENQGTDFIKVQIV